MQAIRTVSFDVGGTLFRLAELFPHSQLRGITISTRQLDIANRLAARKGLQDHSGRFPVSGPRHELLAKRASQLVG